MSNSRRLESRRIKLLASFLCRSAKSHEHHSRMLPVKRPSLPSSRRAQFLGAFAIWGLSIVVLAGLIHQANVRSAQRDAVIAAQGVDIKAQQRTLEEANHRLSTAGQPTVAAPVPVVPATPTTDGKAGPPGVPGQPGPPPSTQEIEAAVKSYCAANRCRGAAGSGVTAAQVAAAIADYCKGGSCAGRSPSNEQVRDAVDGYCSGGKCDGKTGSAGKDGNDGKDGAPGLDGKDGPPGSPGKDGVDGKDSSAAGKDGVDGKDGAPGLDGKDGAPGIDGKDGAPGVDGKDGKDGRGIASVACEKDELVVIYTDDSKDVVGVCVSKPEEPEQKAKK